jgi:hypothetical protein
MGGIPIGSSDQSWSKYTQERSRAILANIVGIGHASGLVTIVYRMVGKRPASTGRYNRIGKLAVQILEASSPEI